LMGVLSIAGIPLFAGWYSKDAILAQAIGYVRVHPQHALLFLLPLATAGITTFYMFRMWLLTFTGEPRDHHVHEHAHESPALMTVPLILLAVMSVIVAWGHPIWDPTKSQLEHAIYEAQPRAVLADFGHVRADQDHPEAGHDETFPDVAAKSKDLSERQQAHGLHGTAGFLALAVVFVGLVFALLTYYSRVLDPAESKEQFPAIYALLENKYYFDEIYSVLLVRPSMIVARAFSRFDLTRIDGVIHGLTRGSVGVARWFGRFDSGIIDGLVNLVGNVTYSVGSRLRRTQTGYLRSYVLFMALAAVGFFILLTYFVTMAAAG
jgi:NADH-quinone oxidoreductase subunit L